MIFEQQLTRSMRRGNSRLRCHAVRNCCANSMKQGHTSKHHRMKPRESNTRTPLLIVRALIKKKGSERVGWAEKPSTYFIVGRSAGLCSPAYALRHLGKVAMLGNRQSAREQALDDFRAAADAFDEARELTAPLSRRVELLRELDEARTYLETSSDEAAREQYEDALANCEGIDQKKGVRARRLG